MQDFPASDGTERFTLAIDALDSALGLSGPGAARLLVIVSDGYYIPGQLDTCKRRVAGLRASGRGIPPDGPIRGSPGHERRPAADPCPIPPPPSTPSPTSSGTPDKFGSVH